MSSQPSAVRDYSSLGGEMFQPLFVDRLRLRSRNQFLKARIVSQRIPLPARAQIGECDAFLGIIDCKRSTEETLDPRDGLVRLARPRTDQSQEIFCRRAFNDVARNGFQLDGTLSFAQRVRFP